MYLLSLSPNNPCLHKTNTVDSNVAITGNCNKTIAVCRSNMENVVILVLFPPLCNKNTKSK